MFTSKRQHNGCYLIKHTDDIRFGRIILKTCYGWHVLSEVTGEDMYSRFVPFRTKRQALNAVKEDF